MGYDLLNAQDEDYRFDLIAWPKVLHLARQGGWKPTGTLSSAYSGTEPDDWGGCYTSNDGQWVTPEDAAFSAPKEFVEIGSLLPKLTYYG